MKGEFTEHQEVPCEFTPALYLAGYSDLVDEVSATVDDSVNTLLALGHNPGWESVVYTLTGESVTMKTANAALLECEGDTWSAAIRSRGQWRQRDFIVSRELSD